MKFAFAPEAIPLPGYTIKRAIDRGGFGEVYYALSDSGKEVALKLLQRNQQVELRGVSQCLNLKHPNLVTIYDIKTDDEGDHWVVMEYVSGRTLEQAISENPSGLPLDDVEAWLAGIASGTAFLHDRGIVHRDLKPANVFRENGIVKIGDVGLSKFITPSRRSAQTESVGTVYYMAPEVARGKYGSELDVYSLGVILFEMLTGHVPFSGESTGEILMKHLTEPPDLSKIEPRFRGVIARALEKDPQKRTAGATRLLEEFQRARRGQVVAEEIPASHFVDVPQLERSAVRRSPAPAANPVPRQQVITAETIHYTGYVNGNRVPGGPQPPQQPGEVPLARECGRMAGSLGRGFKQLLGNSTFRIVALVALVAFALRADPGSLRMGLVGGGGGGPKALLVVGALLLAAHLATKKNERHRSAGRVPEQPVAPRPVAAPVAVAPPPLPVIQPAPAKFVPPVKPVSYSPNTVRPVSFRQRMSDLTGSMTVAVLWTALVTAGIAGFGTQIPLVYAERTLMLTDGGLALFAVTTLLGAWALLVSSKLTEGTDVDNQQRRLIQTALGAAVGAAAWGVQDLLLVDLPYRNGFNGIFKNVGNFELLTTSSPTEPALAGYILFFAALFGIRRWWWQADAFRSKRFSLGSLFFTGLVAFMIPAALVFQQNWGLMWAVAISTVVQLSAPRTAERNRAA
jgi:hypothetical protein